MRSLVLTGAAGAAAELVVARLAAELTDVRCTVLVPRPASEPRSGAGAQVTEHVIDLVEGDLAARLQQADADAVVHLGLPVDGIDPYLLADGRAAAEARSVLDAAGQAGVEQVVVLSSTLVYGALASNAVPLTEDAVVHPDHAFRPAVELAEIEREVIDWREEPGHPATAVLRCAPVVAEGASGWLAAELHRSLAYPVEDHDPPLQYLHAADLGNAIVQVLEGGFAGVANVAPDGWLDGPGRRALETRPRVRVPAAAARFAASLRGAARGTDGPEGIRAYVTHPWVVANDRLRGLGWSPEHGNDEAYVEAFRPAPWSMVSSSRRQELALGAAAATIVGVGGAVGAAIVRRRHR